MHPTVVSSPSTRPPDNELYERGSDLVEAAASIRRLAADPRAARAVPAVLLIVLGSSVLLGTYLAGALPGQ